METNERRDYFRVEDRLKLKFRILSKDEFNALEHTVRYSPISSFSRLDEVQALKVIEIDEEKKKDPLYTYLNIIDRKLDLVLDYLMENADDKRHYITQYIQANISGSGIRFFTDADIKEGDYVELILILPIYPHTRIPILCNVLRCIKQIKDGNTVNDVAMQYLVINENDRDMLIQYIFMKEREMLRNRSESTG
ncbi:MAG TPA: PilZ domain-containing protein [Syntrophorhabdaceae bacterium]|nr:PilZ domain-containing protein [Syntrophorhabdaceae bacterium]HPP41436.1 PilZ domain-containing protein [Syntrophorhabdaceae bacterium]